MRTKEIITLIQRKFPRYHVTKSDSSFNWYYVASPKPHPICNQYWIGAILLNDLLRVHDQEQYIVFKIADCRAHIANLLKKTRRDHHA